MHTAMNWSLVAQRTICSATQFAGDISEGTQVAADVSGVMTEASWQAHSLAVIKFIPDQWQATLLQKTVRHE